MYDFASNLQHTTVRLDVTKRVRDATTGDYTDQISTGTGTGFFFDFYLDEADSHLKTIVTNRHVMEDTFSLHFTLNESNHTGYREHLQHPFTFNDEDLMNRVTFHPDDSVDLCVIAIGDFVIEHGDQNINFFMRAFSLDDIPTRDKYVHFTALEEVVMIGYPFGLWDVFNNLPIMRKGHTASHIFYNYLGQEDFLVNIPAFHGSSGSPLVIVAENGNLVHRSGELFNRTPCLLLGIQKSIPPVYLRDENVTYSNLGVFVKSYRLYDFVPLLIEKHQDEIASIIASRQDPSND